MLTRLSSIIFWTMPNVFCYNDDPDHKYVNHIVPVARLEAFRALKLSRLESFRALKFFRQIGTFSGPKTLQI